ncbi:MAG TPA: glycosyltransferase family 2 protein [Vicinamibacterales bacterium]|nr:glycosyltransferase family 2 protein [Vicinamibacterales bacterium]
MIDITGLVLTFNEAPNIERTLAKLSWLRHVCVIDSNSTDGTAERAAAFPNVRVITRAFTTHAEQWNFGLAECGHAEWVLALDADYLLSDALIDEVRNLNPPPDVRGYSASFDYCIDGRPLRGAAYPPVTVLYRRNHARYEQDGHTQRVRIEGTVTRLNARICHDDRKSLSHWLGAQAKYMELEAIKLTTAAPGSLGIVDRLRRWIVITPPAMFLYCYLVRGGILDGRAGLFYALQRATSEAILSMFLVRRYTELASRPNSARRAG